MNRPYSPCEPDTDYKFGHCVEKSVMRKIGCQPPWRRVNVEGLPLCDNATMLAKYTMQYFKAVEYGKGVLMKRTNCLMPCTFMEYKVRYFPFPSDSDVFLQIAETSEVKDGMWGSQGLKLLPMFTNEMILIRKEVEVFPFISLVADCGGILGLFLGFNFLMIWEWLFDFIVLFREQIYKN